MNIDSSCQIASGALVNWPAVSFRAASKLFDMSGQNADRAAREKKSKRKNLAFELARIDRLAEFVGKMIDRQNVTDPQRVHIAHHPETKAGGQWRAVRGADFCHLFNPCAVARDNHPESHRVPRLQARSSLVSLTSKGIVIAGM